MLSYCTNYFKTYHNNFFKKSCSNLGFKNKKKKFRMYLNHQVSINFVWEYLYPVIVPFFFLDVHEFVINMVSK